MEYSKAKDWQVLAAAVSIQEYILLQSYRFWSILVYIGAKHKQSGWSLPYSISNLFWSYSKGKDWQVLAAAVSIQDGCFLFAR